jgi:outer membrane lipoprotein-sorting protein
MSATQILAAIVALLPATTIQSADDQAVAWRAIKRAMEALGHPSDTHRYKGTVQRYRIKSLRQDLEVSCTGQVWSQPPDKIRIETFLWFTMVIDGDKGWIHAHRDDKTIAMSAEDLAAMKESRYANEVSSLAALLRPPFRLTSLGDRKVNDRPAIGVRVTCLNRPPIELFFDKQSGLLVKSARRVMVAGQPERALREAWYEDYREVNGVKWAMKTTYKEDGKLTSQLTLEDVSFVDKFDSDTFSKP